MGLEIEASSSALEPRLMRMRLYDDEQLLAERVINFTSSDDYAAWRQAAAAMRQHERLVLQTRGRITAEGRLGHEPNPLAEQAFMDAVGVLFPMFGQPVDGIAV